MCALQGQDPLIGFVVQGVGPVVSQIVTPLLIAVLLSRRSPKDEVKNGWEAAAFA
jgi:hypothetical protein